MSSIHSNHCVLHMGKYGVLAMARRHPKLFARLLRALGRV